MINDDKVQSGRGFAPHDHENMEIITYVRSGAITHHDSLGHEGRTAAGDVQVMSAGSGVTHSEFNREDEATTLYQIWIEPNEANVPPRWDQQKFPAEPVRDALRLLVSGQPEHEGLARFISTKMRPFMAGGCWQVLRRSTLNTMPMCSPRGGF